MERHWFVDQHLARVKLGFFPKQTTCTKDSGQACAKYLDVVEKTHIGRSET